MGGKVEAPYDRERTRRALEALRRGSEPRGVREGIAASWRRSQAHGVRGDTLAAPYDERALVSDSALLRAADPVLLQLGDDLAGSSSCVVLADCRGRILRRVTGDDRLDPRLDELSVAPGFDFSERWVGTNALGTALHDREVVVVHEREHFHDQLARWCCSATPVRDPLTDRVLGALGIAAPARRGDSAWSALARQSGLLVESRLFDLHADGQRELYGAYLTALRQGRVQVFAVGPDLLRASPEVRRRLAVLEHDELWARAVDALVSRHEAQVPLDLGGTTAGVRFRAVEHRGRLVGALGELRPAAELPVPPASSPRLLPLREYAGWSVPVRAAAVALRRLAEERQPVSVVGEAGTGKATMVELVAARVLPRRPLLTIDAAIEHLSLEDVAAHLAAGSPVLVRHAENLRAGKLDALVAQSAERAGRDGWLALTWRGEPDAFSVAWRGPALRVVTLPPLRSRPDDVGVAVERVLRTHREGQGVTFSPALLERLRRQPWPTNLTGLAEVVDELLACRRGPVVDVGALDEVFRAMVRRRLTPVEWLLRAAIVDALQAHGGNKEAAAASLGMSRASIYRKIKSVDIDLPGLVRS